MKKSTKVILLVLIVLALDQALKIWVKTNMQYGEEIWMFGLSWARLHFVENPGMAFGLSLGGPYGKLFLSLFRIVAVIFLAYYIRSLIRQGAPFSLLACFGLIMAGAFGNIIDSAFYGLIFSESSVHISGYAEFLPEGGGYAGFLHGRVVDMLYFPLFRGTFPEWFPFWGNEDFLFFRPVFNLADSAITTGVLSLLVFHRNFFKGEVGPKKAPETAAATEQQSDAPSETPESPERSNEPPNKNG